MSNTEVPELDGYDAQILEELQRDARISMAELGRKLQLSQPAVTERVRKMEIAGFLRGYRAVVDYQRLGYGIRALVRCGRTEYARMLQLIEQTPEVVNAYNLTGADSWLLEIAVIDVEHLDAVVTKFSLLTDIATSIVLNTPREHATVPPARRENIKPVIRKVTGR
jgi:Lrp/AsnC family leucine-responsive transcriptional regulator